MTTVASGQGTLVWLASYPKSGNTWMRVLLANYFQRGDEPVDINVLGGGPIASAREFFDDHIGVQASDLTHDEIDRLRPLVYQHVSDSLARGDGSVKPFDPARPDMPPILKVHDAYTRTDEDNALFPAAATAGAIYLIRNPLDIAPSYAHHSAWAVERAVEAMGSPGHELAPGRRALANQLRQRLLTWSDHVRSWVDHASVPLVVVRYEDLLDDPHGAFARVLRFLEVEPDEAQLARAVDWSSFDRLQAQEADATFRERNPRSENFFRKGVAGDWETALSADMVATICRDHGEVMQAFGYTPPVGSDPAG